MKRYFKLAIVFVIAFVLVSCGSLGGLIESNPETNTPTNENSVKPKFLSLSLASNNSLLSYDDDDDDNDVEDFVDIEVNASEKVEGYVKANSKFIIVVKLSNPSKFEIQSFTLNGVKYANYMFEKGSDLENLYLEVTSPNKGGIKNYSLDAIKYIDGTDIEDIDLSSGKKSIKIGVGYDNVPVASVKNLNTTTTSINFNLVIDDENGLIKNDVIIALSDGKKLVGQEKYNKDSNEYSFTNLKIGTNYQLGVITSYDLCYGNGEQKVSLYKKTIQTLLPYSIDNIEPTANSVVFELTKLDANTPSLEVTSISLIDMKYNKEIFKLLSFDSLKFENLLSNHSYKIKATYVYVFLGNKLSGEIEVNFRTKALNEPTVTFDRENADITASSIKIPFSIKDISNTLVNKKIEIYLGDVLKETKELNTETSIEFENLLSNTEYNLVLIYKYNLNDGNGEIEASEKINFKTLAFDLPTLDFEREATEIIPTPNLEYKKVGNSYKIVSHGTNTTDKILVLGGYKEGLPITTVDFHAFLDCLWIEEIVILDTITLIDDEAFLFSGVKKIYFESPVPPKISSRIQEARHLDEIIVPNDSYEIYKNINNPYWISNYQNKVKTYENSNISYDDMYLGKGKVEVASNTAAINIIENNPNKLITERKVELYSDNNLVKVVDYASKIELTDLLSNTEYKIIIKYKYDLKDGSNPVELEEYTVFKTLSA